MNENPILKNYTVSEDVFQKVKKEIEKKEGTIPFESETLKRGREKLKNFQFK